MTVHRRIPSTFTNPKDKVVQISIIKSKNRPEIPSHGKRTRKTKSARTIPPAKSNNKTMRRKTIFIRKIYICGTFFVDWHAPINQAYLFRAWSGQQVDVRRPDPPSSSRFHETDETSTTEDPWDRRRPDDPDSGIYCALVPSLAHDFAKAFTRNPLIGKNICESISVAIKYAFSRIESKPIHW